MADIETMAVSADGTPIVKLKIIDKEAGTETPVNVSTCAEAVSCRQGIPMETHLANLYSHANDESIHLTAEQKANMETQQGAQEKADAALELAKSTANLELQQVKLYCENDASEKANKAREASCEYTDKLRHDLEQHSANKSNPHNVTAAQVGLGNVPNKSTNDQQPTFTAASALTALTSGEKLTLMLGKIAKAISVLISLQSTVSTLQSTVNSNKSSVSTLQSTVSSHQSNKSNPHGVTAAQAGAVPTSGGTMTGNLKFNGGHIILKEGVNYGTSLPTAGTKGRVFFKVVS